MATLAQNYRTFLLDEPAIAEIVGERVYHNVVSEESDVPLVVFLLTGSEDESCLDDPPGTPPFRFTYQVECWAKSVAVASALALLVKNRLNNYSGEFGEQTVQGSWADYQDEANIERQNDSGTSEYGVLLTHELVP